MSGINAIRLDLNTAKYHSATARKKVSPVEELNNQTGNLKKREYKAKIIREFDIRKHSAQQQSNLIMSSNENQSSYRASLLNQIVNKMSGLEKTMSSGQYIEYYA